MGGLFGGPPIPPRIGSRLPSLVEPEEQPIQLASAAPVDRPSTLFPEGKNPFQPRPRAMQTALADAPQVTEAASNVAQPSEEDVNLLARLIFAEAGNHRSVPNAMEAVGWAVRNRLNSGQFPSTVESVIRQPGEFSSVDGHRWNMWADRSSLDAVEKRAYDRSLAAARNVLSNRVADPTNGAMFFYSSDTGEPPNRWFKQEIEHKRLVRSAPPFWQLYFFKRPQS